jgi:hypothetical protein
MNTTAEGFPLINAPSGSTATVTATDWTAKVATLPVCLPSGWRHDSRLVRGNAGTRGTRVQDRHTIAAEVTSQVV